MLVLFSGCGDEIPSFDPINGQTIIDEVECEQDAVTCPGTPLPQIALEDFQPQSPNFGELSSLEAFKGKPILLALLA